MRVRIICGNSYAELEDNVNEFLKTLPDEPKEVRFDLDHWSAVVLYNKVRKGAICCECKCWDCKDEGMMGLCQKHGGRKRFSNKACEDYEDVRGER